LNAFGILAVAAILTGWRLTRRYATYLQLDPDPGSRFARVLVIGGAAGAFAAGFRSAGALAGAALAGLLFLKLSHRSLRYFDAAALAFPPAWLVFRAGCAIVHDHPGAPSSHFLAVRFSDGPRWDLGLLELLATVPLAIAFVFLGRRSPPPGLPSAVLAITYGAIRVFVSQFAGERTYIVWFGCIATAIGALILTSLLRSRGWSFAPRSFS
jgi:prolipoprotein diacylglyceryltransferase